MYFEHIKKVYDETHKVWKEPLPIIGVKVFMEWPVEKANGKYPKLTIEWGGPYRAIERGDTSAVITKIGANYKPFKV